MGTSVRVACVMVITFVATVQVTTAPSALFRQAAPLIVVKSSMVIVSLVLTVAENCRTFFVTASVVMTTFEESMVSILSCTKFSSSYFFYQSPLGKPSRAMTVNLSRLTFA